MNRRTQSVYGMGGHTDCDPQLAVRRKPEAPTVPTGELRRDGYNVLGRRARYADPGDIVSVGEARRRDEFEREYNSGGYGPLGSED
jgi:hypothetical protein